MKKIMIGIIVIGIIIGLGLGGFWLYRKYINPNISSELEIIEINPDERNGVTENLTTKDEKIDMIIQLIEDLNTHKISYNLNRENGDITFYVKDKYEIEFIQDSLVTGKDYMERKYVSGTENSYCMWTTNSKIVHRWVELKKATLNTDKNAIEVDLDYTDEVLYGKYDMMYNANASNSSYKEQFSKLLSNLRKNRNDLEYREENGIFNLNYGNCRIETDGIKFINIFGYSIVDYRLELNNKELYDKIIAPIKGIKNFPTITNTESQPAKESLRLQSKYDHEKLMEDYIDSIEPKDQTWTVDKVEELSTKSYVFKGEDLSLICSASGKLVSSQMPNEINLNYSFMIDLDKTVMTTTESAGVTTVKIVADKDDIVKTDTDGHIDDLSLNVTLVIQSDMSYSCQYSCYIKYSSSTLSFEQTFDVKENGKVVDTYIEIETMASSIRGEINNLIIVDSNNNKCKCENTKYEFTGKEPVMAILGLII